MEQAELVFRLKVQEYSKKINVKVKRIVIKGLKKTDGQV
jgi:hypothetical protein